MIQKQLPPEEQLFQAIDSEHFIFFFFSYIIMIDRCDIYYYYRNSENAEEYSH